MIRHLDFTKDLKKALIGSRCQIRVTAEQVRRRHIISSHTGKDFRREEKGGVNLRIAAVDFQKAFESIEYDSTRKALRKESIDEPYVKAMKKLER